MGHPATREPVCTTAHSPDTERSGRQGTTPSGPAVPLKLFVCAALAGAAGSALFSQPANPPRAAGSSAVSAWQRLAAQSHAVLSTLNQTGRDELPPLPAGVNELQFSELYGPIGDRGLEYSATLRSLEGRLVRIAGHMIREQERSPGVFRLAGWPVSVATKGICVTDTAPPTTIHVIIAGGTNRLVPYRPGRIALIGRIELGPRLEADGRNSAVRLVLDAASAAEFAPPPES